MLRVMVPQEATPMTTANQIIDYVRNIRNEKQRDFFREEGALLVSSILLEREQTQHHLKLQQKACDELMAAQKEIAQLKSNVAALEESNENWMLAAKEAARQVDLLREQLEPDH
jgi:hypothetical protein